MKNLKTSQQLNEASENFNISDVSDSLVNLKKLKNIIEDSIENGEIDGLNYVFGSDWFEDLIKVFNENGFDIVNSLMLDGDVLKNVKLTSLEGVPTNFKGSLENLPRLTSLDGI